MLRVWWLNQLSLKLFFRFVFVVDITNIKNNKLKGKDWFENKSIRIQAEWWVWLVERHTDAQMMYADDVHRWCTQMMYTDGVHRWCTQMMYLVAKLIPFSFIYYIIKLFRLALMLLRTFFCFLLLSSLINLYFWFWHEIISLDVIHSWFRHNQFDLAVLFHFQIGRANTLTLILHK